MSLRDLLDGPAPQPTLESRKIKLGATEMSFAEWQTKTRLLLEHNYHELLGLMHIYNVQCFLEEKQEKYQFCSVKERLDSLLPAITQLKNYQLPQRRARAELGDELTADTPLSEEDQQAFTTISNSLKKAEQEWQEVKRQLNLPAAPVATTRQSLVDAQLERDRAAVAAANARGQLTGANPPVVPEVVEAIRASGVRATERPVVTTRESVVIPEAIYVDIITRERQRDMREILAEQTLWYENAGLPQWATAARALQDRWLIDPALRQTIERKREAGHLIVAMPGRDALLQTAALTMQNLIPHDVENNQPARESNVDWDYITNLINNNGVSRQERATLVVDIPSRAYFMDFVPTEQSDYRSKTVPQQIAWLQQLTAQDPTMSGMTLLEYIAAQFNLTHLGSKPMDAQTFTRFITILRDGLVVGAHWYPDNRQLGVHWYCAESAYSGSGVRLVGRVN